MSNLDAGPFTDISGLNTFTLFSVKQSTEVTCENGPPHSQCPLIIDPSVHISLEPSRGRFIESIVLWTKTLNHGNSAPNINLADANIELILRPVHGSRLTVNEDYYEYGCLGQRAQLFDLEKELAQYSIMRDHDRVINAITFGPNHPALVWRENDEPIADSHKIFMLASDQDIQYGPHLLQEDTEVGFMLGPNKVVTKVVVKLCTERKAIRLRWLNRTVNYLGEHRDTMPEEIGLGGDPNDGSSIYTTGSALDEVVYRGIQVMPPRNPTV